MASLVVIRGNNLGQTMPLKSDRVFTIGRRSDNDLTIQETELSRYHCEIHFDGEVARLVDKESRHGTYVNGEPALEVQLEDGDEIRLGKTLLRYKKDSTVRDEEDFATKDSSEDTELKLAEMAAGDGEVESGTVPSSVQLPTVERRKRTWITLVAVAGVAVLVGIAAFLLVEHFAPPEAPTIVPMEQLKDMQVQVVTSRRLLERPPTYVIDIDVENTSDRPLLIRLRDFQAMDTAGGSYTPLKPTAKSDFKDVTIDPGAAVKGSINFELSMGAVLTRLQFQDRGYLMIE